MIFFVSIGSKVNRMCVEYLVASYMSVRDCIAHSCHAHYSNSSLGLVLIIEKMSMKSREINKTCFKLLLIEHQATRHDSE